MAAAPAPAPAAAEGAAGSKRKALFELKNYRLETQDCVSGDEPTAGTCDECKQIIRVTCNNCDGGGHFSVRVPKCVGCPADAMCPRCFKKEMMFFSQCDMCRGTGTISPNATIFTSRLVCNSCMKAKKLKPSPASASGSASYAAAAAEEVASASSSGSAIEGGGGRAAAASISSSTSVIAEGATEAAAEAAASAPSLYAEAIAEEAAAEATRSASASMAAAPVTGATSVLAAAAAATSAISVDDETSSEGEGEETKKTKFTKEENTKLIALINATLRQKGRTDALMYFSGNKQLPRSIPSQFAEDWAEIGQKMPGRNALVCYQRGWKIYEKKD